ncbi:MAG: hypothetical protein PHI36_06300 [Bacteroidales bacterium]|nr:hypothetical protein [Bacteroidales bacterium]
MNYNLDYNTENETQNQFIQSNKRPVLLTILCILTFIASGFSALSNISWAILYDTFSEILLTNESPLVQQMADTILATNRSLFFVDFILYIGSVAGALLMFNLKKIGFHIYTVSNILLVLTPAFFVEGQGINFMGLILITLPFIVLYAMHLKYMK